MVNSCPADNVTLTATSANTTTFHWYKDGTLISGATGSTYNVTESGSYYAAGVNTEGVEGAPSPSQTVTINLCAGPATISGPTSSVCPNFFVTLTASSANAVKYNWYTGTPDGPVYYSSNSNTWETGGVTMVYYVAGVNAVGEEGPKSSPHGVSIPPYCRDIADATITITGDTVYTGSAITPDFAVVYNDGSYLITLEKDVHYTNIAYSSPNTDAGTQVTITLTGKGYYFGTKSRTFTIAKATGNWKDTTVSTAYSPTLTLGNIPLTNNYTWEIPATSLNAGNGQSFAAAYTDPSGNYEAVAGQITVNVAKATGSWIGTSALSATYTPTLTLSDITLPNNYAWEFPAPPLNAGNGQSFAAAYTDPSGNYEAAAGQITVNVAKADITPPVSLTAAADYGQTLDAAVKNSWPTSLTGVNGEPVAGTWDWVQSGSVGTVAAPAAVSAKFTHNNSNYNQLPPVTVALTVKKINPTAALLDYSLPANYTYNGSAKTVTVTAKGTTSGLGVITVKYNDIATAPVNAGIYTISVSIGEGDNYKATSSDITLLGALTIAKAAGIWKDTTVSTTYTPTLRLSDIPLTQNYTWTTPTTAGINAGNGQPFAAAYTNPSGNYEAVPGQITVNVNKAPVTKPALKINSFEYDGTEHRVDLDVLNPLYKLDGITTATNYGNYPAVIILNDTVNYKWADGKVDPLQLPWTITKINPTAALLDYNLPVSYTYDGAAKSVAVAAKATATANGLGSLGAVKYNGAATAPANAGNYPITISIDEGTNYKAAADLLLGTLTINKANITAPVGLNATAIYGQTLADVGTGSWQTSFTGVNGEPVAGTWAWVQPDTTSVGTVATPAVVSAQFTHNNNNYNQLPSVAVTLIVAKGTPDYTAPTGLTAVYGWSLANVLLPAGFSWVQPETTLVGNVGNNPFKVTYTHSDAANYNPVTGIPVTIAVRAATAKDIIPPTTVGVTYSPTLTLAGVPLLGGSTDKGSFAWTQPNSTPVVAVDRYLVTFTPNDPNIDYTGIPLTFLVMLHVAKADYAGIAHAPLSATYTADNTLDSLSGLQPNYWWVNGSTKLEVLTGSYPAQYNADPANYNDFSLDITVNVAKGTPAYTAPTGLTATYGKTLGDVALPAGFSWEEDAGTPVGNVGNNPFKVTYTHSDVNNYNPVTGINVSIAVSQAAASAITFPNTGGITYSPTLTLAGVPLLGGSTAEGSFAWTHPDSTPVVAVNSYLVTFTPNNSTNIDYTGVAFTRPVALQVAKADYTGIAHAPLLAAYTAANTLDSVSGLQPNYWWVDGTTKLEVSISNYPAQYNADPSNYNDFDLTIAVRVYDIGRDARLKNITLSSGVIDFDPNDTVYYVQLPCGANNVYVHYEKPAGSTTVVHSRGNITATADGGQIYLDFPTEDTAMVSIRVTAEDSVTHKIYTLTLAKPYDTITVHQFWTNVLAVHLPQNYAAFQWTKNGSPIQGATRSYYYLGNDAASDDRFNVLISAVAAQAPQPLCADVHIQAVAANMLSVYPNPVSDGQLTIEGNALQQTNEVQVYNILGQLVKSRYYSSLSNNRISVDITGFPVGSYVVKVGKVSVVITIK
ncbi:hypothetical protein FACS1894156_1000 [Bacteroidia bacterium]|nr:hypothetical protein FACS1894156_1000 [Bacteroidia bacterium]